MSDDAPTPEQVDHYVRAVRAWDDAYADRNGLPRIDWGRLDAGSNSR